MHWQPIASITLGDRWPGPGGHGILMPDYGGNRTARLFNRGDMARTHRQTHDAGRHFVVAEALLRGYPAALVGASSHVEVNGHKALVQVAAKGAWQIADVDDYTSGTIKHIILVDLTENQREFYICPGDKLRTEVSERHDQFLARHGGSRPRTPDSKHAAIHPQDVQRWHDGWDRLA